VFDVDVAWAFGVVRVRASVAGPTGAEVAARLGLDEANNSCRLGLGLELGEEDGECEEAPLDRVVLMGAGGDNDDAARGGGRGGVPAADLGAVGGAAPDRAVLVGAPDSFMYPTFL